VGYASSENLDDHNYRASGSRNWFVEEFELVDDRDCHSNSHLPFTGSLEFQRSETNEGTNTLIGHIG
jgi:hypothetical protein